MSWIHLDDVIGILIHASRTERLSGAINAVSPNPVTNAAFTRILGQALRRPAFMPLSKTALRIAFGEMSEILLASQRALPKAAQNSGYTFAYPDLRQALDELVTPPPSTPSER